MRRSALAPAKVNLFLHVAPLAPDGYHPLASLMVFADVGDRLSLEPAEATGFVLTGPFAAALAREDPAANLAWRAALRLIEQSGVRPEPFRLTLEKRLPVAAGLGGGSSDAGAALRLVREAFVPDADETVLEAIAAELGADGPACLFGRPVLALGRGERLSPAPGLPPLPAVLVNPGVACPTGLVYRAYDAQREKGASDLPVLPPAFTDIASVVAVLGPCRNDLEPAGQHVAPEITEVLDRLRRQPETRLARLSGSGATCFALCETPEDAGALADRLTAEAPGWWVRPCTFRDPAAT
ncbi:4-(cytidine 5'-diphospho)-2-C-methyl-D-erythritol kinase [Caulobacter sp. S45]|uniref:4-(cytidine 5'-diphospho)-2-C-methyl-D-erythritol kinase n=1 Tax=Caulobacter sp. S45 TaxID=1641861 RepID=UPI001576C9DE|nr:4-(cytidine 5'-diphospho)-2-C-methyl-D-erythritol kinase [Caulobacter sp. S45]